MHQWKSPGSIKTFFIEIMAPFQVARDVASFLGFLNFNSMYIPYFEQRVACLRPLAAMELEADVSSAMSEEHESAQKGMNNAITSDPCLAHFDHKKRSRCFYAQP